MYHANPCYQTRLTQNTRIFNYIDIYGMDYIFLYTFKFNTFIYVGFLTHGCVVILVWDIRSVSQDTVSELGFYNFLLTSLADTFYSKFIIISMSLTLL